MALNLCIICLRPCVVGIEILSENAKTANIVEILSKHFWFKVIQPDDGTQSVCRKCWTKTHTFHKFYLMVEKANKEYFRARFAISSDDLKACAKQSLVKQVHSERVEIKTVEIDEVKQFFDCSSNLSLKKENRTSLTEMTEVEFDPIEAFKRENSDNDSENGDDVHAVEYDTSKKPVTKTADLMLPAYFDMACDRCDATFVTLTEAVDHYRDFHNFASGYVKCCGKRFDRGHKIRGHITWHQNPNCYMCEECKKPFKSRKQLSAHKNLVHVPEECKNFQCKKCLKKFSRQYYLNTHTQYANCTGSEEFVCHFCKKKLKSKLSLKLHIAAIHHHDQTEKFMCEVCAKVYYSKYAIKTHLATHYKTEEKPPVQCNLCGNMFKSEHTLKMHIRHIHNPNPLECPHCQRISPNRNALTNHISAVHAKKRHHCTICDKSFTRPIPLKEHMATHTGEDLYTCAFCPKMFKSSANIYKHMRTHPDKWTSSRKQKQ